MAINPTQSKQNDPFKKGEDQNGRVALISVIFRIIGRG